MRHEVMAVATKTVVRLDEAMLNVDEDDELPLAMLTK
jgi:hypothetical protein